jgi:NAD(P)-dependent dehydrogenase (short-subunit alcohol dehydrogenase family)
VAIAYLNEHSDAEETKTAVENEGRRCIMISGDVADPDFCKEAVDRTTRQLGRLDVLVNNAAFQEHVNDFEDLTEAHFDRTIKTNFYGYFHMAKTAIPQMKPGSAIVMTGSVTGLLGNKNLLDYSITKGGIHAFVRSLATHLIDKGIRVNAVAPGPVWTPLNPADRDADGMSNFGSETPMKRPAQSEEIAPAFVFLAAPSCSSYITGEILPIIPAATQADEISVGVFHGEGGKTQIRSQRKQGRKERDATIQAGDCEEWSGWQSRQGQEP